MSEGCLHAQPEDKPCCGDRDLLNLFFNLIVVVARQTETYIWCVVSSIIKYFLLTYT